MRSPNRQAGAAKREQRASRALPTGILFLAFALGCAGLVFGVYSRSLGFQFILDDHIFTSDPRIQNAGHLWDYFANYVWAQFTRGPSSFYRPLFVLWMRINFALSGLSPWGWHLLSIAKHVLVAALLALLVWELVRDWAIALAAATLFALHPAHTESVSWVTVPDPLMSAGLLGALLLYLGYTGFRSAPSDAGEKTRKRPGASVSRPSILWLLGSAGAYFAALLSKETAIVFPAVIFGVALCIPATKPAKKTNEEASTDFPARVAQALGHTAPFLCVTALYLILRFNALGKLSSPTQHLPWTTVMLSWPATLWFYVKTMLWPMKSYSFGDAPVEEHFSAGGVLFPFLAIVCSMAILTALLAWAWRKAKHELEPQQVLGVKVAMMIGTLLLVLPLLPALNLNALNPGDFLHGRYTYLPLAGLLLLIATCFRLLKNPKLWLGMASLVTIAFATLTYAQEAQWNDDGTVFAIAHQLAPHNAPVARKLADTHVQQAMALEDQGRCDEALPILSGVIQDYPDDWLAWGGLGVCYVRLNDLPKAEGALHRAADLSHDSRVIQQWQELRAHMGLSNPASAN